MHDCLETVVMANRGKQRCLSEVMSIGKPAGLGGGGGCGVLPNAEFGGSEAARGLGEARILLVQSASNTGVPGVDTSGSFLAGFHAEEVRRCAWARPQSRPDFGQRLDCTVMKLSCYVGAGLARMKDFQPMASPRAGELGK